MVRDLIYGNEPAVAVLADRAEERARLGGLARAAGGRVATQGTIADGVALLDRCVVDAALVEVADDAGPALDGLLDRLQADAAAARLRSVVAVPPALIDAAAARAGHGDVALISGGGDLDRVAALTLALAPAGPMLFEERGDDASLQLHRVREEVARLARALAGVAGGEDRVGLARPAAPAPPPPGAEEPSAVLVRRMIRARRTRDQFFAPDLFADPAWDMLLDLMLARMEGRMVAVSSLCIAAAVPPTTALRWIKRLVDEGLFTRTADPLDGRRVFIDLSEAGALATMRCLRAIGPCQEV